MVQHLTRDFYTCFYLKQFAEINEQLWGQEITADQAFRRMKFVIENIDLDVLEAKESDRFPEVVSELFSFFERGKKSVDK